MQAGECRLGGPKPGWARRVKADEEGESEQSVKVSYGGRSGREIGYCIAILVS